MNNQPASDERTVGSPGIFNDLVREFEEQLGRGVVPRVEELLDGILLREQPLLLGRLLLLEWRHRHRKGEPFTVDEYLARLPEQAFVVTITWQRWLSEKGEKSIPVREPSASPDTLVPDASSSGGPLQALWAAVPSPVPPEYQLVECLGVGGMGEVYRAVDPRLKRAVAIKRIKAGSLSCDHLARFRREAEAMARLQHPHIVGVHALEQVDGEPLLVLEYVPGGTLEQRLAAGPLPPREAARLVAILAWAMHAAHEVGLVHRDLKPDNILMAPPVSGNPGTVAGGFPKITDFGLAQLKGSESQTLTGVTMGTPGYMSPEQAAGRTAEVGRPTDVWALGVILYRCLTGKLPFQGDNPLDTLDRIKTRPPAALPPEVPPRLVTIVLACLDRSPAARPSAAGLAAALEGFCQAGRQDDSRTSRFPVEVKPPPPPVRRRRRWRLGVLAVVAMLGLGGALFFVPPLFRGPPVRVMALRVEAFDGPGENARSLGALGEDSLSLSPGQALRVTVALDKPGSAYLLAFAPGGEETLLWPVDEGGNPDPEKPPTPGRQIAFPVGGQRPLIASARGPAGLHVIAVVATQAPLPSYRKWKERRGDVFWPRQPGGRHVWGCDGYEVFPVGLGEHPSPKGKGPPPPPRPLRGLCDALCTGPVEAVEAVAFGVPGWSH